MRCGLIMTTTRWTVLVTWFCLTGLVFGRQCQTEVLPTNGLRAVPERLTAYRSRRSAFLQSRAGGINTQTSIANTFGNLTR